MPERTDKNQKKPLLAVKCSQGLAPEGEWKVDCIVDAEMVQTMRISDKPCFHIKGPDGLEGFIWGWHNKRQALAKWLQEYFEMYPRIETTERYFT